MGLRYAVETEAFQAIRTFLSMRPTDDLPAPAAFIKAILAGQHSALLTFVHMDFAMRPFTDETLGGAGAAHHLAAGKAPVKRA